MRGWNWRQAPIRKRYPAKLSLTALMSLIGAVESALMAIILEYKKPNVWAIGWNIELLSVVYSVRTRTFNEKNIGITLKTLHMEYNNRILIGINSRTMTRILHVSGYGMFRSGYVFASLVSKQKGPCIRGTFQSTWHDCNSSLGDYLCPCVPSCGQVSQYSQA